MFEKFRNRYRIASSRKPGWDYSTSGAYFITICTHHRQPFFGHLDGDRMMLSPSGKLAHQFWASIPYQFPHIILDEFIIMPDHMHGIITITKDFMGTRSPNETKFPVETRLIASLRGGITGHHNPMLYQNISTVIRWYKGRSTFEIRKILPEFKWQERFYDRIIRNPSEFEWIQKYIRNNPLQ